MTAEVFAIERIEEFEISIYAGGHKGNPFTVRVWDAECDCAVSFTLCPTMEHATAKFNALCDDAKPGNRMIAMRIG